MSTLDATPTAEEHPRTGKRGPRKLPKAEKDARGTTARTRLEPWETPPAPPRHADRTRARPRPFVAIATAYRAAISRGDVPACKWVRLACARQTADLDRAAADPTWPYVWDPKAAAHVCAFVERLPHVEGRWKTATIRLEPAQVFLLTCLFGWRMRADRSRRRFTSVYWELARKGAKSTLMAGVALYHLLEEQEPGPSIVCGATTGQQARIVFTIASQMVIRSTWLQDRGLRAFVNAICLMPDGKHTIGTMKPINAKASTQDGLNPSCIVLDESHAQKFELHDVLKSAQGARANPLLLCPTTAGYDQLSVGYAMRTTVCKILDGVVTADHVLGLIYTIDDGDDWRDPRVWVKANPMLGVTPLLDQMQRYCLDAQTTPGLEAEFRVKCCSEWANAGSAWLSMAAWDACADRTLTLDRFVGQPCWIGADLAQLDDLAAVALVFADGDRLVAFVRCYLPEDVVLERARAVPEYRLWRDRGELVLTAGSMIDFSRIEADIRAWCKRFSVRDICFDQFGSVQITGALFNSGLPARMEQKNAKTTTGPARELETRVRHDRFRHDGNTCVRWQASNVVIRRGVDDSIVPKKDHPESPNKIDAVDAVILAIGGYLRAAAATPKYDVFVIG